MSHYLLVCVLVIVSVCFVYCVVDKQWALGCVLNLNN